MKFVTVLLTTLLATSALAFTGHVFWEKTYELHETAHNAEEFRALQRKYPEQFGRYDANTILNASMHHVKWELRGDHTCEANDPRANLETKAASLCTKMNDNGPGMCWAQAVPMPPVYERDPCGNK